MLLELIIFSFQLSNLGLYKIVAWYDNELGYTAQMLRTAKAMFK